jgi:hypothetical protein
MKTGIFDAQQRIIQAYSDCRLDHFIILNCYCGCATLDRFAVRS